MRKLCLLLLTVVATACAKTDSTPANDSGESPASADDFKNVVGSYRTIDSDIILSKDHTYSLATTQEIAFDIGSRMEPAARFFPICVTDEKGKFQLFKKGGKSFIRFSPNHVNLNQALLSHHGDDKYDTAQICALFKKGRLQSYEQEYEVPGAGAIALYGWTISTDYFGLKATMHPLYSSPLPNMMFMSEYHKHVEVTEFVGRYLAAVSAPDHLKVNGRFSPQEISYDPKQRTFSFIDNQCGFALDFYNVKIDALDGEFRIDRKGMAVIRPLRTTAASVFRLRNSPEQIDSCSKTQDMINSTALVREGFYFEVTDSTTANFTYGDQKLEMNLELPEQ